MTEYRMCLSREVEARLKVKCDKLADAFELDDIGEFFNASLLFKSHCLEYISLTGYC